MGMARRLLGGEYEQFPVAILCRDCKKRQYAQSGQGAEHDTAQYQRVDQYAGTRSGRNASDT